MELVVATIGLSLGILTPAMYSIVVMVAVLTSFMAPILLRLTMRMVRVTDEEAERMAAESAKGLFDAERLRILVPTAGGPNALVAASIAMSVARRSAHPITLLFIDRVSSLWGRMASRLRPGVAGQNLTLHIETIKADARDAGAREPEIRREAARHVPDAINTAAAKGFDIIMTGASGNQRGMRGQKLEELVMGAPCHVAIVKNRGDKRVFRRLLVPVDGSFVARAGIEFAVRYAEGAGPDTEITLVIATEQDAGEERVGTPASFHNTTPMFMARKSRDSILFSADALADGGLEKLSPVFKTTKVKTHVVTTGTGAIPAHLATGKYDLLLMGVESRAMYNRLFFGYENERLIEHCAIPVVLLVAKVSAT
jgi:nucleotide-binding universal stress UspA family protein